MHGGEVPPFPRHHPFERCAQSFSLLFDPPPQHSARPRRSNDEICALACVDRWRAVASRSRKTTASEAESSSTC